MQDYRMETFITVCESMNFTRAAKELHLAQPTVSLHIHALEKHYGVKLFTYSGKKLALTREGRVVLEEAITRKNDEQRLLTKLSLGEKAPIRLGATLSVAESMLGAPLSSFLEKHERDYVQIDIDNTRGLLDKINAGALDAAFIEGEFPTGAFDGIPYRKEPFCAVCASDYQGWEKWKSLDELFSAPLLLREKGSGTRGIVEDFLAGRRYRLDDFKRIVEVGSVHLIKELLLAKCGISFMYEAAVKDQLQSGKLVKVLEKECAFSHDIFFLWRKGSLYEDEYKRILDDFR